MISATPPSLNGDPAEQMKRLVTEIVRALVDNPDSVTVELVRDRDLTGIRLRVAHEDIGKVIGKQGRTARSLRTILGAASMKLHQRFSLDIQEEGGSDGGGSGSKSLMDHFSPSMEMRSFANQE
jgi:predicted RNA-binding protein YlqC (UPF0109 family)